MARSAPFVPLTEGQRTILEEISRSRQVPHALVQRARIGLQAAAGKSNTAISAALDLNEEAVGLWRRRWVAGQEALTGWEDQDRRLRAAIERLLADAPRAGCPPRFSAEQICQLIALACESPPAPLTHWTQAELARALVKRGLVERISARSVGRFLKAGTPSAASTPVLAQSRGRGRGHLSAGRQARV